jgi:hypothetical protein
MVRMFSLAVAGIALVLGWLRIVHMVLGDLLLGEMRALPTRCCGPGALLLGCMSACSCP